ncbi:MAG TPA: hypothetical protein VKG82_04205 [Solirubrobacteraceae bacterium]|nr:hypothetical protein [Solirubrobacteraceae bacterium]
MTRTRLLLDAAARSQAGFTMIIAIGVMFVTSLLLVGAFTLAVGEDEASHNDLVRKQAYYAALAGVQEYEYEMQANPDYWEKCNGPNNPVAGEGNERYEDKVLGASSAPSEYKGECSSSNPFASAIENKGALANTFRIQSIGYAGKASRTLIATFKVTGFLDYIYFTNFETLDPSLYASGECKNKYYGEWNPKGLKCQSIIFTSGDKVDGPMHTNDAARVEGTATFGRSGHSPPDKVEIYEGTYPEDGKEECKGGSATFYTESGCYVKGERIEVPENDTSLAAYVEPADEFKGETHITLHGSTDTFDVLRYEKGVEIKEAGLKWPKNGLIYVTSNGACGPPEYAVNSSDTEGELKGREGCGDVYVSGTYSESLTIAGENNLVIKGNIYPSSIKALGEEPTGTATLGLIASNFVRVYHPVSGCNNVSSAEDPNEGWGSLPNIYIYAAVLSTSHSFIVDNFNCGASLGKLHEKGAIAQNYRGPVGTTGGTGYLKDYEYDGRLATDEPPYFLAPLKAGWKVVRETAK